MITTVITGASSGIGKATATALGAAGHRLVLAGRSAERTEPVVEAIEARGGIAEYLALDLASLADVRRSALELESRGHEIDVMINNAGIGMARGTTADGFEAHFGTNHLGHFLFNRLLWGRFRPGTRIVTVASAVHSRVDGIDWDHITGEGRRSWFGLDEYAVSKLANVLYTSELARRHPEWRTYAVHPGFVATGILPGWLKLLQRHRLATPEEGAKTTIHCATDPALGDESGNYYVRSRVATPSAAARDRDLACELWERSEQWCGVASI